MAHDPWTDPDPQTGDFDADLTTVNPRYVETHVGNPDAKLTIVVDEDEDAERLQQLAMSSVTTKQTTRAPHASQP